MCKHLYISANVLTEPHDKVQVFLEVILASAWDVNFIQNIVVFEFKSAFKNVMFKLLLSA